MTFRFNPHLFWRATFAMEAICSCSEPIKKWSLFESASTCWECWLNCCSPLISQILDSFWELYWACWNLIIPFTLFFPDTGTFIRALACYCIPNRAHNQNWGCHDFPAFFLTSTSSVQLLTYFTSPTSVLDLCHLVEWVWWSISCCQSFLLLMTSSGEIHVSKFIFWSQKRHACSGSKAS